jgi:S1-C subfamily serine protease
VSTIPAADSAGRPRADARVWAVVPSGESAPRLIVMQPEGAWARAGLHSGDRVVSWNGAAVDGMRDFRAKLSALQVGDTVALVYERAGAPAAEAPLRVALRVPSYSVHQARLEEVPDATRRQRAIRHGALLDGRL